MTKKIIKTKKYLTVLILFSLFLSTHIQLVWANERLLPNDQYLSKQLYLDKIKAYEAWQIAHENTEIKIAILDTGIDLTHPDLQGNLLTGKNILDPTKPPQDDNGHGTNVAGILAAVGNNQQGISGILWQAKIIPVKVLDQNGNGNANIVAEGIYYALDQEAKIILLSLGDPVYSPVLDRAVKKAEEKGVLIVAATGNEEGEINYPAALPTVLAVGAVDSWGNYPSYANYGQELDVVAPGTGIYTTKIGGGYSTNIGTSMAAPQVAGLAALIMSKYPDYTPAQVRNLIRYSTNQSVANKGLSFNQYLGYGLINLERALTIKLPNDIYEENNQPSMAKILPFNKKISAELTDSSDYDWFYLEPPYEGKGELTINLAYNQEVEIVLIPAKNIANNNLTIDFNNLSSSTLTTVNGAKWIIGKSSKLNFTIKEAKYYIGIRAAKILTPLPYDIDYQEKMNDDQYEPNDSLELSKIVTNGTIKGTINKENDEDWYTLKVVEEGNLAISITSNNTRIDPILTIINSNKQKLTIDNTGIGNTESWQSNIKPGEYYIGVKNYYPNPELGYYYLDIHFAEKIVPFIDIDQHWAYGAIVTAYQKHWINGYGDQTFRPNQPLTRAEAAALLDRVYKWEHTRNILNFTDLSSNHWAYEAIKKARAKNLVTGYNDQTFRPNQALTRAEMAALLARVKGIEYNNSSILPYQDVKIEDWYYPYIAALFEKDLISKDTSFRPNQLATRAEFVYLLAKIN